MSSNESGLLSLENFIAHLKKTNKCPLIYVESNDTIKKAIKEMDEKDFSQIPVMENGKIVGIITYELILRFRRNWKWAKLEATPVSDVMTSIKTFERSVDLFNILDQLASENHVVVAMGQGKYDIVTSYDALKYFRENTDPFLILKAMENDLREIISERFSEDEFKVAASKCSKKEISRALNSVDEMTIGDYITFISTYWEKFVDVFKNKDAFLFYLERCRLIRNDNFHFRPISLADKAILKDARDWLKRKK